MHAIFLNFRSRVLLNSFSFSYYSLNIIKNMHAYVVTLCLVCNRRRERREEEEKSGKLFLNFSLLEKIKKEKKNRNKQHQQILEDNSYMLFFF